MSNADGQNLGRIIEIKGVVLDAVFDGHLPAIYNALEITMPDGRTLVAEVQQHLGDDRVRAVAMDATDGLARGTRCVRHRRADQRAGRRGHARPHLQRARRDDRQGDDAASRPRRAGRSTAMPPAFDTSRRRPRSSRPASRSSTCSPRTCKGGKIGLFGGAGVGKTVLIQELINNIATAARRLLGVRRRGRAHARGQRPLARDDRVRRDRARRRWSTAR